MLDIVSHCGQIHGSAPTALIIVVLGVEMRDAVAREIWVTRRSKLSLYSSQAVLVLFQGTSFTGGLLTTQVEQALNYLAQHAGAGPVLGVVLDLA